MNPATINNMDLTLQQFPEALQQFWISYINPPIEFCLILLIIYSILYFFRGTRAVSALVGIVVTLVLLMLLTFSLRMEVFGWVLQNLWTVFAMAMIVIFQPELRRAFAQLGSHLSRHKRTQQKEAIEEIAGAVTQMSFRRCGALIVFEGKIGMAAIINNAVQMEARINSLLVQSIFYPNSPLHDGAIIIRENTIVAAHAILPLSQETSTKNIGTRHRAALGVTEETDAVAVIVSEETGIISAAYRGKLSRDLSEAELILYLKENLIDKKDDKSENLNNDTGHQTLPLNEQDAADMEDQNEIR